MSPQDTAGKWRPLQPIISRDKCRYSIANFDFNLTVICCSS